jgi:hypothetical protein
VSETIWQELSRSPLDPDPNEEPKSVAWLAPAALAIVAGLVLGLVLGNGSEESTATTRGAVAETTTITTPPPADPIVPNGYAETAGLGLRAVAAYSQGGNLYLVVDQVVRSDNDPLETNSLYLAEWVLAGDGVEIVAERAYNSIMSPGVKLVEFPGVTALPAANPALLVREATEMVTRTTCNGCGTTSQNVASGEITLEGLERPHSLASPLLIPVGEGITLSVDRLDVTDEWGYIEWHILDENDAVVRVVPVITFAGTDDPDLDGVQPTQLVPPQLFGPSPQQQNALNPDPFARSGAVGLDLTGELLLETNQPTALIFEWSAEWQHPVGEPITLPLTDLTDLGIID